MDELVRAALSQGLGYALFVWLLMYVLKTQEKRDVKQEERENKYQDLLHKLTEKFSIIENIQDDVKEIKSKLD